MPLRDFQVGYVADGMVTKVTHNRVYVDVFSDKDGILNVPDGIRGAICKGDHIHGMRVESVGARGSAGRVTLSLPNPAMRIQDERRAFNPENLCMRGSADTDVGGLGGSLQSRPRDLEKSTSAPVVGLSSADTMPPKLDKFGQSFRDSFPASSKSFRVSSPGSASSQGGSTRVENPEDLMKAVNARYYPSPACLRGNLKLSRQRAADLGVDPLKDVGSKCPFWEGESHRFKGAAALAEARPRTPTKSLRWRNEESWNDPGNHPALKVTHALQKKLPPAAGRGMSSSSASFF